MKSKWLLPCELCGFKFNPDAKCKYQRWIDHFRSKHFREKFKEKLPDLRCPLCPYIGPKKHDIERHYGAKHNIVKIWISEESSKRNNIENVLQNPEKIEPKNEQNIQKPARKRKCSEQIKSSVKRRNIIAMNAQIENQEFRISHNSKDLFQCERCKEKLLIRAYKRHIKPCKLYYNFIEKLNDGYQCKQCLFKINNGFRARYNMYYHMMKNHSISQDPIIDANNPLILPENIKVENVSPKKEHGKEGNTKFFVKKSKFDIVVKQKTQLRATLQRLRDQIKEKDGIIEGYENSNPDTFLENENAKLKCEIDQNTDKIKEKDNLIKDLQKCLSNSIHKATSLEKEKENLVKEGKFKSEMIQEKEDQIMKLQNSLDDSILELQSAKVKTIKSEDPQISLIEYDKKVKELNDLGREKDNLIIAGTLKDQKIQELNEFIAKLSNEKQELHVEISKAIGQLNKKEQIMKDLVEKKDSTVKTEKLKQMIVTKIVTSDQDNEDLQDLLSFDNKTLLSKYDHLVSKEVTEELSDVQNKLKLKTEQVNVYED